MNKVRTSNQNEDFKSKYSTIETASAVTTTAEQFAYDPTLIHSSSCKQQDQQYIDEDINHNDIGNSIILQSMNVESLGFGVNKGQIQEPEYRDKWFAILFLIQLAIVILIAILYATNILHTTVHFDTFQPQYQYNDDDDDDDNGPNRHQRILFHRILSQNATSNYYSPLYYSSSTSSSSSYNSSHYWIGDTSNQYYQNTSTTDYDDDTVINGYWIIFTFLISIGIGPILSIVAIGYMYTNANQLIKISLFFPIVMNFIIALLYLLETTISDDDDNDNYNTNTDDDQFYYPAFLHVIFAIIFAGYAKVVWHGIPFASANLKAAVSCIKSNLGMIILGLTKIPLICGWWWIWGYTFTCLMNSPWFLQQQQQQQQQLNNNTTSTSPYNHSNSSNDGNGNPWVVFLGLFFIFSLVWTWRVLSNIIHTTLAGTVGTWWFLPQEANTCCSRGLTDSLCRSMTYSLGSICLGSLLVAIIELLNRIVLARSRMNGRGGLLFLCICQCLLVWLERIAEYFNRWAFVYVGVYGYSFMDAGKKVFSLFVNRGWTAIISDRLVNRMLFMMSFCIGLINGLVTIILNLGSNSDAKYAFAVLSLFLGTMMSLLIFSVLSTANESIIVLFCEAPAEFKRNHPHLAQELEDTWVQAWPGIFTPGGAAEAVVISGTVV